MHTRTSKPFNQPCKEITLLSAHNCQSRSACELSLIQFCLFQPASFIYVVVSVKANDKPIFVSAVPQRSYTELRDRDDIPLLLEVKK
jgi:hypothetical protein